MKQSEIKVGMIYRGKNGPPRRVLFLTTADDLEVLKNEPLMAGLPPTAPVLPYERQDRERPQFCSPKAFAGWAVTKIGCIP